MKFKSSVEKHVVFGTGTLGMAVMDALHRQGKSVRMVNTSGNADVPNGVEVVKADAYQLADTVSLTRDASVVYQCASPPYTEWGNKFMALQSAILDGAAHNNCRVVIADNLYLYGDVDSLIHECLPSAVTTHKGIVRENLSYAALRAHQAGKVRVVIGRGSDFFGPRVLNALIGARAIAPAIKGKTAQLLGHLDMPHSFTYIEDFAHALVTLGEHEDTFGQAWHVPNNSPLTQRQLMTIVFEQVGRPPKMATMSKAMMAIVGLFIPALRESQEMMYAINKPYIVDSSKFETRFNAKATPLKEAIKRTIDWYRAHPI